MDKLVGGTVAGVVLGLAAVFAVEAEIAASRVIHHVTQPAYVAPVQASEGIAYSNYVADMVTLCQSGLDEIASSMTEEMIEQIPLDRWQYAYSRCLIDMGATI